MARILTADGSPYIAGRNKKKAGSPKTDGSFRRRVVASFRDERLSSMLDNDMAAWRGLNGSPLLLPRQDYLLTLSYWLYYTNNLIGGMIEKSTDVICGKGFDYKTENPELQKRLDRFWKRDRLNNFAWLQDVYTAWLRVFGECCFTFFTRPDGSVRVGFVEPYNIDRTYTDPGNPFIVTGVRLKSTFDAKQPILTTVLDPTQPEEALFDTATRAQRAAFKQTIDKHVECVYFPLNPRILSADDDNPNLRGTPPLLASFDPAVDAEDVLYSMRRRADMASRILWDVTLEGADDDDIEAFLEDNDVPDEYTVNAHNERVSWQLNAPDLKASEHETQHRIVRNYAIGGKGPGMPPTWFGDGTDANRASAQELPFTTVLGLERQQDKQAAIFRSLLEYQAVQAGFDPDEFDMVLPTISKKDMKEMSTTMRELTAALTVAEDRQWLTTEEARRVYRENLEDLGTELGEYQEPQQTEGDDYVTEDYA